MSTDRHSEESCPVYPSVIKNEVDRPIGPAIPGINHLFSFVIYENRRKKEPVKIGQTPLVRPETG